MILDKKNLVKKHESKFVIQANKSKCDFEQPY